MMELKRDNGSLVQPPRELPIDGEYDVVVVGGGVAGVGAALAAGRRGCRTLLIEQTSALGGLATMGLVNIPLDFASGIGGEMLDRLTEMDGHWHRNTDPEKHKLLLDRMIAEAQVEVLLHSHVVDAIVTGAELRGVVIESKSGREAILARRVIDCSGDGDASAFAGAEFAVGRESDGYTQACSLEFRLGGVDWDRYHDSELKATDPKWLGLIERALAEGDLPYAIDDHLNWMTHVPGRPQHEGKDEVSICFAHSRRARPLDKRDLTRMYIEGREQVDILWRFIRKKVPGFEKCFVVDTAPLLGVRDSRRVLGEYVMTGRDLASLRKFDDVVTISYHGYDIHHPTEVGNIKWIEMEVDGERRYVSCKPMPYKSYPPPGGIEHVTAYDGTKQWDPKGWYDIPYRALVPVKVDNLLVAGRCLSADFEAQSGTRLILCCMSMGEAAGVATALSLKHDVTPRRVAIDELQHALAHENRLNLGQKMRRLPALATEAQ